MEKKYTEEFLNSIDEAMEDKDFVAKLKDAQNADEIKTAFLGKGIEIDDVVASSAFEKLDYLRNGGELTAEEMEMVAGGKKTSFKGWCFTTAGAVIGGIVGGPAGVVAGAAIGTAAFIAWG